MTTDDYEIEPWQIRGIGVSPGAPIPVPEYVPFTDFRSLKPGNYFSHTVHPHIAQAFNKADYSVKHPPKGVVEDIYNKGLKVRLGNSKFDDTPRFRPAAWNYKVTQADLGNSTGSREHLLRRMGNSLGLGANAPAEPTGAGMNLKRKADYVKPRYAANTPGYNPPKSVRAPGTGGPTFIYKGPPEMFDTPTEHYKPNEGPAREIPKGRGKIFRETGKNPYAGTDTGRITKKPIGHFPAGSDQFMTKPGMVTGRMPMVRGIGGGLIDMFMKGPEWQRAVSEPHYGIPEEKRRLYELHYQYGI